jgi:hypothetical protein
MVLCTYQAQLTVLQLLLPSATSSSSVTDVLPAVFVCRQLKKLDLSSRQSAEPIYNDQPQVQSVDLPTMPDLHTLKLHRLRISIDGLGAMLSSCPAKLHCELHSIVLLTVQVIRFVGQTCPGLQLLSLKFDRDMNRGQSIYNNNNNDTNKSSNNEVDTSLTPNSSKMFKDLLAATIGFLKSNSLGRATDIAHNPASIDFNSIIGILSGASNLQHLDCNVRHQQHRGRSDYPFFSLDEFHRLRCFPRLHTISLVGLDVPESVRKFFHERDATIMEKLPSAYWGMWEWENEKFDAKPAVLDMRSLVNYGGSLAWLNETVDRCKGDIDGVTE